MFVLFWGSFSPVGISTALKPGVEKTVNYNKLFQGNTQNK